MKIKKRNVIAGSSDVHNWLDYVLKILKTGKIF